MTPRLKSAELRNVHGIRYLKMDFGQITVIRGANGVGKSSIIDGIGGTFRGGYNPAWARDPEAPGAGDIIVGEPPVEKKEWSSAKARSTVTLTDGSYIVRDVDREKKTSTVKWYSANGEEIGGQTVINDLVPIAAFDPVSFLRNDEKGRQNTIMRFLRVSLSRDEIEQATNGCAVDDYEEWVSQHFKPQDGAFVVIDRFEKALREQRTKVGRDKTSIEKTIQNLQHGVPTLNQDSAQVKRASEEAELNVAKIQRDYDKAIAAVKAEALAARQKAWSETDAETQAVESWLKQQIALLEEQARTKKADIMTRRESSIAAVMQAEQDAVQDVALQYDEQLSEAQEAHRKAKDALDAYNRADGLRTHLAGERQRHADLLALHNALERSIERLIELRKKKMEEVKIPGLEMRDGVAYYNGLLIDGAINKAQQIELAVQIAALSTKNEGIPFMILDEAEHLDKGTLNAFLDAAVKAGFQVVYATVEEDPSHPLTVQAVDASEVA